MTNNFAIDRSNFTRNLIFIETTGMNPNPVEAPVDRSSENRSYDLPNNIIARITGK